MTDHSITASLALPQGTTLEIEQEMVSYTTMHPYEADPAWVYTDHEGHQHDASRSTLVWYITRTWYCEDCRDEHDEGEWRCKLCGEVIEPGQRYIGNGPHMLPGLRRGTLHGPGGTYHLLAEEMAGMPGVPYADDPPAWDAWLARVYSRTADSITIVTGGCDE